MQSPKFPQKAKHLQNIVSASTLQKLWKNHVRDRLRRQIVPDPVEFLDFHIHVKQRCWELESVVCSGGYLPRPVVRLKVEKSKGLCRQIALPSPEDALLLQALSNALWNTIKASAPKANAFYAPQDQPFSKKNTQGLEDELGYGPIEAWLDFQETLLGFSNTKKFIVVTDIANYYDSILHSYLRSILADYAHEKEHALDLLIFTIDSMLWRPDYMPYYGIGLPQTDFDAPRLLAHTHLFEIDELFRAKPSLEYARYMDDIDFGVDSVAAAKSALRDLDLALQTRNLRLNSGKTKILNAAEALWHFRATDNANVDVLEVRLEQSAGDPVIAQKIGRIVVYAIDRGLRDNRFKEGNGGKILKRLLGLAIRLDVQISLKAFRLILYGFPALRERLLKLWSRSADLGVYFPAIIGFILSGEAIDDLSPILIATSLVEANTPKPLTSQHWSDLLKGYSRQDSFQLFCRLWLISRFGSVHDLKSEIDQTNLVWSRHPFLSRTVAGFYGLFLFTPHFTAFEKYVRRWGGPAAAGVLDFHDSLLTEPGAFKAARTFVSKENPSLPNRITHAKSLLLATMLWNDKIPNIDRAKLLAAQPTLMTDQYYFPIFSVIMTNSPP